MVEETESSNARESSQQVNETKKKKESQRSPPLVICITRILVMYRAEKGPGMIKDPVSARVGVGSWK